MTLAETFVPPPGIPVPSDMEGLQQKQEALEQQEEALEQQRQEELRRSRRKRVTQVYDYHQDKYVFVEVDEDDAADGVIEISDEELSEAEENNVIIVDTDEEDDLLREDTSEDEEFMEIYEPVSTDVVLHRMSATIWNNEELPATEKAKELRHRLMKAILKGQQEDIMSVLAVWRRLLLDGGREPRAALALAILQVLRFVRRDISLPKRRGAGRRVWRREHFDCFVRQLRREIIPAFSLRFAGKLMEVLATCVGAPGLCGR